MTVLKINIVKQELNRVKILEFELWTMHFKMTKIPIENRFIFSRRNVSFSITIKYGKV